MKGMNASFEDAFSQENAPACFLDGLSTDFFLLKRAFTRGVRNVMLSSGKKQGVKLEGATVVTQESDYQ
jgi:hypothetical protein